MDENTNDNKNLGLTFIPVIEILAIAPSALGDSSQAT
jgi:hypothetical protein